MKKNRIGILLASLLIFSSSFAQDDLMDWSVSRKLSWNDYEGTPNSEAAASTSTYIGIEYRINGNAFSFSIQCRFSKKGSWGSHKTAYILAHEQGHFDIAEIFARKLNQQMKAYKFNERSFKKDLKKIYNDVMKEKEMTQNEYDKETNHSINSPEQIEWLAKIKNLLEEYKSHADYH